MPTTASLFDDDLADPLSSVVPDITVKMVALPPPPTVCPPATAATESAPITITTVTSTLAEINHEMAENARLPIIVEELGVQPLNDITAVFNPHLVIFCIC